MQATYTLGHVNMCSLAEHGVVTEESVCRVVVRRVHQQAIAELEVYMDRVLKWIQAVVYRKEALLLSLASLTCDFIRDDGGVWWLVKLHSFTLTALSRERVLEWRRLSLQTQDRDARPFEALEERENQRTKLRLEKAGHVCRLCGLYYTKSQTVHLAAADGGSTSAVAYGYMVNGRMATTLAQIYRDHEFPLTETARLLLFSQANRNRASDSRFASLMCCFYCFQVLERHKRDLKQRADYLACFGVSSEEESRPLEAPRPGRTLSSAPLCQWRLLFMFHSLVDVPRERAAGTQLADSALCLSYTLGHRVSSVTFAPSVIAATDDKLCAVSIKQCRLHYVFGE